MTAHPSKSPHVIDSGTHDGIYWEIRPGTVYESANAYILLPVGHPWRLDTLDEVQERPGLAGLLIDLDYKEGGWLGFSTVGPWDAWPDMPAWHEEHVETRWTIDLVRDEVLGLAKKAASVRLPYPSQPPMIAMQTQVNTMIDKMRAIGERTPEPVSVAPAPPAPTPAPAPVGSRLPADVWRRIAIALLIVAAAIIVLSVIIATTAVAAPTGTGLVTDPARGIYNLPCTLTAEGCDP